MVYSLIAKSANAHTQVFQVSLAKTRTTHFAQSSDTRARVLSRSRRHARTAKSRPRGHENSRSWKWRHQISIADTRNGYLVCGHFCPGSVMWGRSVSLSAPWEGTGRLLTHSLLSTHAYLVSRLVLVVMRSAGKRKDAGSTPCFGFTFLFKKLWFIDTVSWLCPAQLMKHYNASYRCPSSCGNHSGGDSVAVRYIYIIRSFSLLPSYFRYHFCEPDVKLSNKIIINSTYIISRTSYQKITPCAHTHTLIDNHTLPILSQKEKQKHSLQKPPKEIRFKLRFKLS